MALSAIRRLVLKLLPIFFGVMVLWQFAGLSKLYQTCLASAMNVVVPLFDHSGLVKGVTTEKGELLVRILLGGRKIGLATTSEDITANVVVLLSLFLSSPIRPLAKVYCVNLVGAVLVLFVIHIVTFFAAISYALTTNPDIARVLAEPTFLSRAVFSYNDFYNEYGRYLFVLLLWAPYIILYLSKTRTDTAG